MLPKTGVAAATLLVLLAGSQPAWGDDLDLDRDESKKREGGEAGDKTTLRARLEGSKISLGHYVSAYTFSKDAELTWNPTVLQLIALQPRWEVNDELTIRAELEIETELTNSDETVYEREPVIGDLALSTSRAFEELPGDLAASVGIRLSLPTSQESRARRRWAGLSCTGQLEHEIELGGGVSVTPNVRARAAYSLATAREVRYEGPSIERCRPVDGNCSSLFDHEAVRSPVATFQESAGLDLTLTPRLEGEVSVIWMQGWLHPLSEYQGLPDASGTNWRYVMSYSIGLDYEINDHFGLGAGMETTNPQQRPDSSSYPPFFNRYTYFYITAEAVL
ncbi:MAG: hypothetical protein V2A73_14295 [Pseudomonadota bacterium]